MAVYLVSISSPEGEILASVEVEADRFEPDEILAIAACLI